ncbi:hypothetical protein IM774_02440 [Erysipelotrichaceae bacterium RD49]|nr:hypothetical protein [Erysipelotrichaceae bacterium RD49]
MRFSTRLKIHLFDSLLACSFVCDQSVSIIACFDWGLCDEKALASGKWKAGHQGPPLALPIAKQSCDRFAPALVFQIRIEQMQASKKRRTAIGLATQNEFGLYGMSGDHFIRPKKWTKSGIGYWG